MGKILLASTCALVFIFGTAAAQPPLELQQSIAQARGITQDVGALLLGERLQDPVSVRDLAQVMNLLTFALRDMAVYAEYGAVTEAQRDQLSATLDQARLMVDEMEERILEQKLQP
ncbi:MAG: hypothetical protein M0R77_03325 [Gammaproteobacteria bacterium]|nr:hypothetical protein [Gammaproteobacteria bacterium]